MKNFIALIILTVLFNPSFANNEEANNDINQMKNQIDQSDEINLEKANNDNNSEYFNTLRKTNSPSRNILGIGQNKEDSYSTDTEICSIAANKGERTGLCGVPADTSDEESNNDSNDEPS